QWRQREPHPDHQPTSSADRECENGFDQRDPQVTVDGAVDDEPVPDSREDPDRFAEEELRVVLAAEKNGWHEPRLGHDVPDDEEHDETTGLPDPQVSRTRTDRVPDRHSRPGGVALMRPASAARSP